MTSKHLNERQVLGLLKVGDLLVPGEGPMPSFSASGCATEIDRVLDYLYGDDLDGVKGLFSAFAVMPRFAINGLLVMSERDRIFPGVLGGLMRMVNLGLKGIIFTLYYSDVGTQPIHNHLKWETSVRQRPEDTLEDVAERMVV